MPRLRYVWVVYRGCRRAFINKQDLIRRKLNLKWFNKMGSWYCAMC